MAVELETCQRKRKLSRMRMKTQLHLKVDYTFIFLLLLLNFLKGAYDKPKSLQKLKRNCSYFEPLKVPCAPWNQPGCTFLVFSTTWRQ